MQNLYDNIAQREGEKWTTTDSEADIYEYHLGVFIEAMALAEKKMQKISDRRCTILARTQQHEKDHLRIVRLPK